MTDTDRKSRKLSSNSRRLSFASSGAFEPTHRGSRHLQSDKAVENTYQLAPNNIFQSFWAKRIAESIVKKRIPEDAPYEAEWAKQVSTVISNDVRKAVKCLPYDRYRYVVQCYLGQKRGQGIQCASRALTEATFDSYDEYLFQNKSLWCLVLVHAMYLV